MLNTSAVAAIVSETAPLRAVAAMMEAGGYQAVVVRAEDADEVLGVLFRDAVLRLSPRLPDAPVRLLPLQKTTRLGPHLTASQAQQLLNAGQLGAVLLEQQSDQSWSVMLA